ncbi:hypothetical protein BCR32DRAFT_324272 [Anaeromyces robustus]|uniref:Uncharacterized protein n=1 Tax=Anaeromyces robustus TaxID=1754192 RepID=A0A1Y1XQA5_9FUNG|nr:hypothetical protein BCR32DRAFT_324272 [Anaeromyces robustus]|eukprot:ORX87932.1 hypothetical protein BCR32DRAFT_324272 [Anaeromyces robustus]
MKLELLTIILVSLLNAIVVLSNPIKKGLLDGFIDYNLVCKFHYDPNVSEGELKNWLSEGVNYRMKTEILKKNMKKDEVENLRLNTYKELVNGLEKADELYHKDNKLVTRMYGICSWPELYACCITGGFPFLCPDCRNYLNCA